ncbi:MAG TPA: hypothetical protein VGC95_11720 [Chitinophagaceae bacterium]
MDSRYYIQLTLRTPDGPHVCGQFSISNNRQRAEELFRKLHRNETANEESIIYLDFVERVNGVPVVRDIISCTLAQLGENCKLISKELFKLHVLSVI